MTRQVVGIDVGYGYTKAVAPANSVIFPSAAAPPPPALLDSPEFPHRVRIRTDNGLDQEHLIGEAALRSASVVTTLSRKKPAAVHDLLLLSAAYLTLAGEERSYFDTELAVGLPLAYYPFFPGRGLPAGCRGRRRLPGLAGKGRAGQRDRHRAVHHRPSPAGGQERPALGRAGGLRQYRGGRLSPAPGAGGRIPQANGRGAPAGNAAPGAGGGAGRPKRPGIPGGVYRTGVSRS